MLTQNSKKSQKESLNFDKRLKKNVLKLQNASLMELPLSTGKKTAMEEIFRS